jgi:hypothetical protein
MSRPYFLFSIRIHVRCRHRSKYLLPQTKFNVSFIFFDNQLLRGLISFQLLFQRNMKNKKNGQNDINGIFIVWNNERSFFILILLRFSFVFFIILRFRKSYRMVLSYRLWALFDYWIFLVCLVAPPPFVNMTELWMSIIQVLGLTRRKTWFSPPFSWKMPVPSREYDSCFLVSHLVMSYD